VLRSPGCFDDEVDRDEIRLRLADELVRSGDLGFPWRRQGRHLTSAAKHLVEVHARAGCGAHGRDLDASGRTLLVTRRVWAARVWRPPWNVLLARHTWLGALRI
jgi:hypothetical protein